MSGQRCYGPAVPPTPTARERGRRALIADIIDAARRQLATSGAAGLSVRAVTRDLGMVSSAIYRYFPTRDALLTALIVEGYTRLADAAEQAESVVDRDDHHGRWMALGHAVRSWAVDHPHEWALLYGSPVPGYDAPADTVAAGSRVAALVGAILADAHAAGSLTVDGDVPDVLAADAARVRDAIAGGSGGVALPEGAALAALAALGGLVGAVDLEVYGQLRNTVTKVAELHELTLARLALLLGLRP
jgi:AcrR family transcriptional regulator